MATLEAIVSKRDSDYDDNFFFRFFFFRFTSKRKPNEERFVYNLAKTYIKDNTLNACICMYNTLSSTFPLIPYQKVLLYTHIKRYTADSNYKVNKKKMYVEPLYFGVSILLSRIVPDKI